MLVELSIRDIVLIEQLTIRFERGLAVLTGETGAGKSILLDALSLALGGRGDASLVRHGAVQGQVVAVFDLSPSDPLRALLDEAGIDADPGEPVFLKRIQSADGRTRAFINDQSVSVTTLSALGQRLVEIHGQHDDRALVDPAMHRDLIDAFGGLQGDAAHLAGLFRTWRGLERHLAEQRARVDAAMREADFLRASVDELTRLAPETGEEDALAEKRAAMMRAEKVAGDLNDAHETLSGAASPVPGIAGLLRRLERKAADVPGMFTDVNEHLARALDHLAEAQNLIERAVNEADHDPRALERVEERLFGLRAAGRKYGVPVADLPALAVRMADDLAALDAGEERLAALGAEAAAAREAFDRAATALSAERRTAAGHLADAVMAELPALKLEKARFLAEITTDPEARAEAGIDTVEFHVQTNPGTRPGPMMKVASGGELSRFLLALKVALADRGSAPTLVFDEIDTGVGGAVADAIGARLARLAETVQVLSVTHAPQVAARARHHFLIAKGQGRDAVVATSVREMDEAARLEEIARMLAGAQVTDEARAAARTLRAAAG